ncbi:MAG: NfeD family protein [Halobacteriaceae archaeon]
MAALVDQLPLLLIVAGVALSILEAISPGAHFVVVGVALLIAGFAGLLFPPLGTPIALAALVLASGGGALWVYRYFDFYGGKGAGRTSDAHSLAGAEGTVTERVTTTGGQVRLYDGGFDPVYSARSVEGDIEAGEDVIVVDPGGGSVLTVASLGGADDIDRELAREREADRESAETADRDADAAEESGTPS